MKSLLYWSQGLINLLLGILRFSCSGKVWHMLCANRSPRPKRRVIYHSTTQQVVSMLIEAWTPKITSLSSPYDMLLPTQSKCNFPKLLTNSPKLSYRPTISGRDVANCEIGYSDPARPARRPRRGRLRSLQLRHGSGMMRFYAGLTDK